MSDEEKFDSPHVESYKFKKVCGLDGPRSEAQFSATLESHRKSCGILLMQVVESSRGAKKFGKRFAESPRLLAFARVNGGGGRDAGEAGNPKAEGYKLN